MSGQLEPASWDAFISHASEDKDRFVRPLAHALTNLGARVWYDEFSLKVGDSLSRSIDKGLEQSKYGIVVLTKGFMSKPWPEYELRGLVAREIAGYSTIIPIWHGVDKDEVLAFSPPLADKIAINTADASGQDIALRVLLAIRPDIYGGKPHSELKRIASGDVVKQLQHELQRVRDDLPSLLTMQGHFGIASLLFSGLWFIFAVHFFPSLLITFGFVLAAIAIVFGFLLLQSVSFACLHYFTSQLGKLDESGPGDEILRDNLEARGRISIAFLSISNVIVWCALIWLTGGATSPLIPFYIMIFVLTLTKLRTSGRTSVWVLCYFLFGIMLAFALPNFLQPPIDTFMLSQSGFQAYMSILFICASLIVPTMSEYLIELRRQHRRRDAIPFSSDHI